MVYLNKILIFFIPVFLAYPDLSINFQFIHLRYYDIFVYFFVLLNLDKMFKIKTYYPKKLYGTLFLMIYISFMILIVKVMNNSISMVNYYEFFKIIGSIPYLPVLSIIFNNSRYRKIFLEGAFVGGIIYLFFVLGRFSSIIEYPLSTQLMSHSYQIKRAVSFQTLNPNTVGILAVIYGWLNILRFYEYREKNSLVLSLLLFMIPFLIFARAQTIGVSLSLFLMFLIIVFLKRISFKLKLLIGMSTLGILLGVVILYKLFIPTYINKNVIISAYDINIRTGEGLSGRYTRWLQGLELFTRKPLLGYGIGTEVTVYLENFGSGMSHNIFLHYLIEMGLLGVGLFFYISYYILKQNIDLFKTRRKSLIFIIRLLIFLDFLFADQAGQLLYLNKYAFLIFAMTSYKYE